MNKSALFSFLDCDLEALRVNEIISRLESVIDGFGFDYYTLTRQPLVQRESDRLMLAGRWPDGWPEVYVEKKYAAIDPTIRYLGYCQRGFSWREAAEAFEVDSHAKRIARMLKQARRFGLEGGYVFPVHGRQGLAGVLNVAGRAIELKPGEVQLFETVARRAFWAIYEGLDLTLPVGDVTVPGPAMTKREIETLNLLAEGFTSGEMGDTLGLSAHTVDWYMNGIQNKLDAKNRHHAVAIAFRRGLIN